MQDRINQDPWSQRSKLNLFMARNTNQFVESVPIWLTDSLIAYGVYMTTKLSHCQYDIALKGQVEIYLEYDGLACNTNSSNIDLWWLFIFGAIIACGR